MLLALTIICLSLPLMDSLVSAESIQNKANQTNLQEATNGSATMEEKVQRLNKLKEEVKELTTQIKEERRRRHKSENSNSQEVNISRQLRRWKKKVQSKLRHIMNRLEQLEEKMQSQKNDLKKILRSQKPAQQQRRGNNRKRQGAEWKKMKQLSETLPPTDIKKVQIQRKGDAGELCRRHGECRPGHCCQRESQFLEKGKCKQFNLKEGTQCEHNCACEAQLLCYREKNGGLNQIPKAICKRASADDLLNGHYENKANAIFNAPPNGQKTNDIIAEEGTIRRLPIN